MSRPRPRGWFLSILALGLGFAMPRLAGLSPSLVESFYAGKLFPNVMEILTVPARSVSWSIAQALLLLAAATIVIAFLHATRRAIHKRSLGTFFRGFTTWLATAAILVLVFHLVWGLNYARPPAAARYGLAPKPSAVSDLARVTRMLAKDTNDSYALALGRGEIAPGDTSALGSRLLITRETLAKSLSDAHGLHNARMARVDLPLPKYPWLLGEILTRCGISGIYIPFTGEATVNALLPEIDLPFVMAHEMAHQRGIAREDEANFTSWLACRESGHAVARYSASLAAYNSFLNALAGVAPDSMRLLNRGLLDPGPTADRKIIFDFWRRYEGPGTAVAERVNDAYLKANAQREGTRSYGRMVDLILAHEAAGRWDPGW